MPDRTAHARVQAPPEAVRDVLLNVSALPEWNAALRDVATTHTRATSGHTYAVTTRLPGSGQLVYDVIEQRCITWRLTVLGGTEVGEWRLDTVPGATLVTHTIRHSGPTFAMLRGAMRDVPRMRLGRLVVRLGAREF